PDEQSLCHAEELLIDLGALRYVPSLPPHPGPDPQGEISLKKSSRIEPLNRSLGAPVSDPARMGGEELAGSETGAPVHGEGESPPVGRRSGSGTDSHASSIGIPS